MGNDWSVQADFANKGTQDLLRRVLEDLHNLSRNDGAAMTPSDLLATAQRNLRVLDVTVSKLQHANAAPELRAIESGLLFILRSIKDENSTDCRHLACG